MNPVHIVLLSDLHLPGTQPELKLRIAARIAEWADVHRVICLGDSVATVGTEEEWAAAAEFYRVLNHPCRVIPGNHDVLYDNIAEASAMNGLAAVSTAGTRRRLLENFTRRFGEESLGWVEDAGPCRIIGLGMDAPTGPQLAGLSGERLAWLDRILGEQPDRPTIIAFHAPLWEQAISINLDRPWLENFLAQPRDEIAGILRSHPQVFLWTSGHIHLDPFHPFWAGPVQIFDRRVRNLCCPDLNGFSVLTPGDSWLVPHNNRYTISLFLHHTHAEACVYDHIRDTWRNDREQFVPYPSPREPRKQSPSIG